MSTVTIVTRTKDRPVLLARAIESVLGQSHEDWEHIIVNDGGNPDGVEELVERHEPAYGGRVRVLHQAASTGMQHAANQGIAAGSGTYLCLHDDDDSWDPEYLASAVEFLEGKGPESRYQGVITHTELVEETIDADGHIKTQNRRPYIPLKEINLFRIGFENPFPPIAFCFRRSAYEEVGAFDPQFNVAGDYDFNFRFLRKFEIGVIEGVHAFYHIRINPRNENEGNSVALAAREHKIRYNELKNHYLRHAENDRDAALALAFNTARYLVEIEWATHETRERTLAIQKAIDRSAETIKEVLAPEATRAYREDLLHHLNTLTEQSEQHAENLWNDLNARTRETASAITELKTALIERSEQQAEDLWNHLSARASETASALADLRKDLLEGNERIHRAVQAATEGVGQESTLNTALENIRKLSEDLDKSGRNLWTDLNARARENVAAIEANAEQRTKDLQHLQAGLEVASARQSEAMAAVHRQLKENASAQEQSQQTTENSLSELAQALETMSQKLTTLQDKVETERLSRRSLFSLGRLGLIWKRSSTAPEDTVSPET